MSRATVIIEGNVGKDPVIKFTKTGKAFASFSVAVTDRVKEGDDWVDGPTTWFNVTAWNWLAEGVADNVTKGSKVLITGKFKMDEWTDNDGVLRTTPSVTADSVGVIPRSNTQGNRPQPTRSQHPVEEAPF